MKKKIYMKNFLFGTLLCVSLFFGVIGCGKDNSELKNQDVDTIVLDGETYTLTEFINFRESQAMKFTETIKDTKSFKINSKISYTYPETYEGYYRLGLSEIIDGFRFMVISKDIPNYIDLKIGDNFSFTGSLYFWDKNGGYFILTSEELKRDFENYENNKIGKNAYDFIYKNS